MYDIDSIDARDFLCTRKNHETKAHLAEGMLVAIAGGKGATDLDAAFARLDKA